MKLSSQKRIIKNAVSRAAINNNDRIAIARAAAVDADSRGVNVQSASYLHDLFCAMLDDIC